MIVRLWAFVASLPLGVLASLSWPRPLGAGETVAAAGAAGVLGAALASLAARFGDDAPDREAHVARGASAALVALPGALASSLQVGPPAWVWLALALLVLALALWRASRVARPAPGIAGGALGVVFAPLLGALLGLAVAVAYGWSSGGNPEPDAALRAAALDLDSRVPLAEPFACERRPARVETLLDSGAAPRFDADGETIWYEARAADGRVQVHRRAASGAVACWTCGEPGNNRRPAPHPRGASLVFDTDRFATWRSLADTEVMVVRSRGEEGPRHPSRRLTYTSGPDSHALYDPSGAGILWSHGADGRFDVRRAAILSGHGGVLLSDPIVLFRGRSTWTLPLGWSPDGRTLVGGFGQPFAPLAGVQLDPASGVRAELAGRFLAGSVSFSADGRVVALAETVPAGAWRVLPASLGNALARWPARREASARGTRIEVGDPTGERVQLELGEAASWGAPTGIALARDAKSFVLGQRSGQGERLLRVELDCAAPRTAMLGGRAAHR